MKRRNEGFTLVEMLCTVVILLLVSATVTVGTRLAVENYTASITASESSGTFCATAPGLRTGLRSFISNPTVTTAFAILRWRTER